MSIPTANGRYIGRPIEWAVKEDGPNKLLVFVCSFELVMIMEEGEWRSVNDLQITGFFYLKLKDGSLNERQIKSLRESLHWENGVAELNDSDWSQTEVQLVCEAETYLNKSRMKVKFINPRDYQPGSVDKLAPDEVKSLAGKYDGMLRAIGGGNGKPQTSKPADPAQQARAVALKVFAEKTNGMEQSAQQGEWRNTLEVHFGKKDRKTITEAEWNEFASILQKHYQLGKGLVLATSPISEDPQFKDDDLPF